MQQVFPLFSIVYEAHIGSKLFLTHVHIDSIELVFNIKS